MKEKEFINVNVEKWRDVESVLAQKNIDAYHLYDILQNNADDVSVARSFFKTRNISRFVNQLAVRLQQNFSFTTRLRASVIEFYAERLPYTIYQTRWNFFWALIFFVISFGIGYYSSHRDEKFIHSVLGEGYTRMTEENIKSGDPMKVYKESGRIDMTFGIMFNNIRVCFIYFLTGILAGVGSVALMMFEGVRIGAFLNFFARHNLLAEANFTIWMHGILEISAIVIGTAAGITLGAGYIFPKTYSRAAAFKQSARYALNIFLGILPMLVVAALIEGNLTRHTGLGQSLRGLFIFFNLSVIILYFGWYPFYKKKHGFKKNLEVKLTNEIVQQTIDLKAIYSLEDTFKHIFIWFGKFSKFYLRYLLFGSITLLGFVIYVSGFSAHEKFSFNFQSYDSLFLLKVLLQPNDIPLYHFSVSLVLALLSYFVAATFNRKIITNVKSTTLFNFLLAALLYYGLLEITISNNFLFLTAFFITINVVQSLFSIDFSIESQNEQNRAAKVSYYSEVLALLSNFLISRIDRITLLLFFVVISYFSFFAFENVLSSVYFNIFSWNLSFLNEAKKEMVSTFVLLGVYYGLFFLLFILMNIAAAFISYKDLEIKNGIGILKRVKNIKPLRNTLGIIRES